MIQIGRLYGYITSMRSAEDFFSDMCRESKGSYRSGTNGLVKTMIGSAMVPELQDQ